jgi:hypothetical protein
MVGIMTKAVACIISDFGLIKYSALDFFAQSIQMLAGGDRQVQR